MQPTTCVPCGRTMVLAVLGVAAAAAIISVAKADATLQLEVGVDELGQRCRIDSDCYRYTREVICLDRRCACRPGYKLVAGRSWVECRPQTLEGDGCSVQRPCSSFSRTFCFNGTCTCRDSAYFTGDRCETFSVFEKREGERFRTTSKFNVLAILMIVAILVVALLFLINQRNMLFYFPCCMRDAALTALQRTAAARTPVEPHLAAINVPGIQASNSQASLSIYSQDKPPSYAETVLNVQYLPTYQEAAAVPTTPKPS